jgi:hypothetical protein
VSRCVAQKACAIPGGKSCIKQVGDLCKNNDECCSGLCSTYHDGQMRCAPSVSCRTTCETCRNNRDCCSGVCKSDAQGGSQCVTEGTCLAEGEVCTADADCCRSDAPTSCVEEPVGLKVKRCRAVTATTDCLADGYTCQLASRCCSKHCARNQGDYITCFSACRSLGEPCGTRADCCDVDADCVSVGGVRSCALLSLR